MEVEVRGQLIDVVYDCSTLPMVVVKIDGETDGGTSAVLQVVVGICCLDVVEQIVHDLQG